MKLNLIMELFVDYAKMLSITRDTEDNVENRFKVINDFIFKYNIQKERKHVIKMVNWYFDMMNNWYIDEMSEKCREVVKDISYEDIRFMNEYDVNDDFNMYNISRLLVIYHKIIDDIENYPFHAYWHQYDQCTGLITLSIKRMVNQCIDNDTIDLGKQYLDELMKKDVMEQNEYTELVESLTTRVHV